MSNQAAQNSLNAACNAALLIVVPTADTPACMVAPHVRHEKLPSLLAVETSTHRIWRRFADPETAYLGTNAGSAGFFYLFAATEQGIHDQGAGHLFLIEEALHQPLCHVSICCYTMSAGVVLHSSYVIDTHDNGSTVCNSQHLLCVQRQ